MGRTDGPEERMEAFDQPYQHEHPSTAHLEDSLTGSTDHEWPLWSEHPDWDDWYDKMMAAFQASGIRRPATITKMQNTDLKRMLRTFATSSMPQGPGAPLRIDRARALVPIVNCWSDAESKVLLTPGARPDAPEEVTGVKSSFWHTIHNPGPKGMKKWESLEWEDQYKRAWIEVSRVEVCGGGSPHLGAWQGGP